MPQGPQAKNVVVAVEHSGWAKPNEMGDLMLESRVGRSAGVGIDYIERGRFRV